MKKEKWKAIERRGYILRRSFQKAGKRIITVKAGLKEKYFIMISL